MNYMRFRKHGSEFSTGHEKPRPRPRFSPVRTVLTLIGLMTVLYFLVVYVLMPVLARLS